MAGRIVFVTFGTILIVLTVGDALFTENTAREQHGNLIGVLGAIGLMIAAVAMPGGQRQAPPMPMPPVQHPQAFPHQPTFQQPPPYQQQPQGFPHPDPPRH